MDGGGGYQSLLGLTTINSNSSTIDILDVENININGIIDLSQATVGGLTTSQVDEGLNLYFTDTRVNNNSNVSSNTTHRGLTNNPHSVSASQVGIDSTDDITEGLTNLYYTDARFDTRFELKTTADLKEGISNLYYTDIRFDSRLLSKTTDDVKEGLTNLYYTTARVNTDFDARLAIKSTTDLSEGLTNLYYTTARANTDFDARLAIKSTTDLSEGLTILYYTTARVNTDFDARLAIKSTTDLSEGLTNLYYTTARANTDFDARLALKTTDDVKEGLTNLYYTTARVNTDFDARLAIKSTDDVKEGISNLYYTDGRFEAGFDSRLLSKTTDDVKEGISNLYYTDIRFDSRLLSKSTDDVKEGLTNLYYTTARVNTDFDARLAIKSTDDVKEGLINLYYTTARVNTDFDSRLLSKTTDDVKEGLSNLYYTDTRVNSNSNVSSNTAHRGLTNDPHSVSAAQVGIDSTDDVKEGLTNLYYTDSRVSANTDVVANTAYRNVGHLPLTGGTLNGYLDMGYVPTALPTWSSDTTYTPTTDPDWVISRSGEYNTTFQVWKTFNKTNSSGTDCWICPAGRYNTDGTTNGNTSITANVDGGSSVVGEWIQLQHSTKTFRITSLDLTTRFQYTEIFREFILLGSTDKTNWTTLLDTETGFSTTNETKTFIPTVIDYFNYYRVCITYNGNITYCSIGKFEPSISIGYSIKNLAYPVDLHDAVNKEYVDALTADVPANTAHRGLTNNPHSVSAAQVGIDSTDDVKEGLTNLYYTEARVSANTDVAANTAKISYPAADSNKVGFISVTQAVDLDTMESNITTNNAKISYPAADSNKVGFISVTQAVNLDTMESNITTNNANISYPATDSNKVGFISVTQAVNLDTMESNISTNNAKISYPAADSNKVGFISVTQAVDLDTMESNISTNNAKISYPAADSNKVGFISVTQAVNLDTMESNISTNNAKISYPAADSNKVGFISVTQAVDLDTMESNITTNNAKVSADGSISTHSDVALVNPQLNDILIYSTISQDWGNGSFSGMFDTAFGGKSTTNLSEGTNLYYTDARVSNNTDVKTNTAKVSASGSINTHSDVNITTPADGHVLTYNTGVWVNATPAAVDLSGYLQINGTTAMTGNLNMGNQDIDNVNQVFIDRTGLANNKLVLFDGGVVSTSNFYGLGIQSYVLMYNIPGTTANHKFYYDGSNELFRIGHAGINAYRTLNATGDITVSGDVQGYAKSTDVSTNYHAKADHVIPSSNNVYDLGATPGGNYKLFRNLYLGGHASIYDYLMIGGSGGSLYAPYLGATKGLQIRAVNGNIAGPHVQYMTDTDFYPLFQQLNWSHDNINLCFDSYYDGAWRSSDAGSNFRIAKAGDTLSITSNSGTAAGGAITWNTVMSIPTNGALLYYSSIDAKMGSNTVSLSTPTGYPGVIVIDASRRFDQYMQSNYYRMCFNYNNQGVKLTQGATSWVSASDRRYKKDIEEIKDCCAGLTKVKPYKFFYTENDEDRKLKRIGLMSQEVEAVYPELVETLKETTQAGEEREVQNLDYTHIIPILVGAVQELKARIEILESQP